MSGGTGAVSPVSGISSTFKGLESIGNNDLSDNKFKLEIEEEKREFDVEIGDQIDCYDTFSVYYLKLNGHIGKCLVFTEEFKENINDLPKQRISDKLVQDLVLSIEDIKAKNVVLSGGKGSSLAALTQMANISENKFLVPKGLIVTTNAYKELIDESQEISNKIDELEKVAWSV